MCSIRFTTLIAALMAFIFVGSASMAQPVYDEPTITGYELTAKKRVSRTDYLYTFKAEAQNANAIDLINVTGTAACSSSTATLVDNELTFGTINAGTSVQSEDTFSIRINRRYDFDDSSVTWMFEYTDPNDIDHDGDGYSYNNGDCDDENAEIHPDATETCNGIDDDCDGEIDEDGVCDVTGTPNPEDVATPLSKTEITGFFDQIYFLFAGSNPIQTGMTEGEIDEKRAAVIRGVVKDQTDFPLEGVEVTILSHSEYGGTLTRADGEYDLVVNGGGDYTLNFSKSGYLTVQRKIEPDWQDYTWADDIVLIRVSGPFNPVEFGNSGTQLAFGNEETDDDGTRQAVLYIPGSTGATMHFEDGSTESIAFANITITEYTVGDLGLEAMPAELPTSSAYTYAAEFRVEEAVSADATSVTFDQPLYGYIENFLGFPTGTPVPAGYYDRTIGAWIPSKDGQVIEITSITDGAADIDADGDGNVDNGVFYADTVDEGDVEIDLGVTIEERQQLASLYSAGQTIWRVPIQHLSPIDWNHPPPITTSSGGAPYPTMPKPTHGTVPTDTPATVDDYGTIDVQNQIFRENIGLSGTPFSINYSSERVEGNVSAATINIPLSGETFPGEIPKDVRVTITTAGQRHKYSVVEAGETVSTNLSYTYTWNGEDAYGRKVQGVVPMKIGLSYIYEGYYSLPKRFAKYYSFSLPGREPGTALVPARRDIGRHQHFYTSVDASKLWYAKEQAIGGWTIDAHHAYDPGGRTLYLGDGSSYRADNYAVGTLHRLAGTNTSFESTGDGGSALEATFSDGIGFTVGPDGSIYFTDACKVRKIDPDGIITTMAGQEDCGYNGDGGLAVDASLSDPMGLDIGPDGSLYIADSNNGVIRKIAPDGIITTVAGDYDYEFAKREDFETEFNIRLAFKKPKEFLKWVLVKLTSNFIAKEAFAAFAITDVGDGGPATEAYLDYPIGVAVDKDGSLYIAEMFRIRKVDTNGIITTYAGGDAAYYDDDWIPAAESVISYAQGIALGPDGSIYYTESGYWPNRVRRIFPNGIVTTIAGTGPSGTTGDGGLAVEATVSPGNIIVSEEGIVYFSESNGKVRKINSRGILSTVIGGGSVSFADAEGAPSPSIDFSDFYIVPAFMPDGELLFRVGYVPPYGGSLEEGWNSIWKFNKSSLLSGDANSDIVVPNQSGTGLYIFDSGGMHLETRNALTGAVTLSFGYDSDDRLVTITDADGNVTTIDRDGSGNPTGIVAPAGQTTELTLDTNGYLETVTNPAQQTIAFDYTSGGLLTGMTRPKGNVYTFEYDSLGRLERAQKPDGSFDALTRNAIDDEDGRSYEVIKTNGMDHQTTYRTEYLTNGDVQKTVIRPDGLQNTTIQSPDGTEEYTTPDGVVTTITRTPSPRFGMLVPVFNNVTVTTPNGVETVIECTRVTTLLNESDITSVSFLVNTTTINGRTFTETYDGATRQYTRLTPTGRTSSMTIDEVGRIIGSQTGDFNNVTYSYESDGKLSSVVRGDRSVQYGYDTLNNLDSITNALGNSVTFTHTDVGKIDAATDALGNMVDLDYEPNGRTTGITTPRGNFHQFGYNDVDMVESYTDPAGNSVTYQYNDEQNIEHIILADGGEITFGYDTAGRTVGMTDPSGISTTGSYDSAGRLSSVERSGETVAFSYDGYLATQVDISGSVEESIGVAYDNNILRNSVSLAGKTITYTYDDDGLVTQAGDMTLSRNSENGFVSSIALGQISIDWDYNSYGESILCSVTDDGAEIYSEDYSWNELRRIMDKNVFFEAETVSYEYFYDAIGQLTGVYKNGTTVEEYSYDANHNRTLPAAVYDNQDRLESCNGISYSYSDNGFLETSTADTSGETTIYNYTKTGELASVVLGDGTIVNYRYDGMGRRIQKEISGSDAQKFIYLDQLGPIAELDASNNVVSRFVYATMDNVPDYMIRGGVNYLLVKDQVGSVHMVVNSDTGEIVQKIDYDSFGQVTHDTNPGFQPFGFAGGMYDPDTGLVHFDRRDYNPSIGRWTAKDPIRFAGGTTNLYAYAGNDPVSRRDPTGLKSPSESMYSDAVDAADTAANWEGMAIDAAQEIAKNVPKGEDVAKAIGEGGDVFGFVSTTTSFLKYIDTANAYYYDGKGSVWDVAHDFGSFANNAIGLIPYPPTQAATKAIGYIDTLSTPIMTSWFTDYYIQQSSNLPPPPTQAVTPTSSAGYGNVQK